MGHCAPLDQFFAADDAPTDLSGLLALRAGFAIVHHVPGRLRLRLGADLFHRAQARGLDPTGLLSRFSALLPGVTGSRLNPAAASLVIDYDPARLSPLWWETLILGDDDDALAALVAALASTGAPAPTCHA